MVRVERPLELGELGVRQRAGQVDPPRLDTETGQLVEADHLRNSGSG
jgi:hypothetical protein